MNNPYADLPPNRFWRTGVVDADLKDRGIYRRKFALTPRDRIATAGSCFAQHISRRLRASGYNVLDVEPAPAALPADQRTQFGYELYSARYGNIYTMAQLLQLAREAFSEIDVALPVWPRGDRFADALRPNIEPDGLSSHEAVVLHRARHLAHVRRLFEEMDVFIFTMGLTEHWFDRQAGLVLPMAPGTVGGVYDRERHEFRNSQFNDVLNEFREFQRLLVERRGRGLRIILTVSPVPLTATYEDRHVLTSTVASKSILRAVASLLSTRDHIDYFPSFEIVTNPAMRSMNFMSNLRTVTAKGVDEVMGVFFSQHEPLRRAGATSPKPPSADASDAAMLLPANAPALPDMFVQCEEELLDEAAR